MSRCKICKGKREKGVRWHGRKVCRDCYQWLDLMELYAEHFGGPSE